ncbi:hypothetical protein [Burkholderia stabilis]|uniref:hypothetical protein n=1 Tax=Burkholderia stabilis TaxID=95485 RepID=UPI001F4AECC4|nr:hypothetical protein [Burkholderia stabilis]
MELSSLKTGERYAFHTKAFEAPLGEVVPGETRIRTFIGIENVGAVGMPKEPFAAVERESGSRHLIAASAIEAIEPLKTACVIEYCDGNWSPKELGKHYAGIDQYRNAARCPS